MTQRDDFDRSLTAWLAVDAPVHEPEHLLGQVLARTAHTRRRSAWRIPERWLPVSTITTRVEGASRFPWRAVGVIALLIIALAVGALMLAGSRKPVPAPFGPAHNGQLLYSAGGDIIAIDAPGAPPRTILGDPASDSGPLYSPDGLRFAFVRGEMASSAAELWVADATGAHPRVLAKTPFIGWAEWSPRSDVVAVSLDSDRSIIRMVKADGSGATDIDTGLPVAINPIFRPTDGGQIAFRGQAADGTPGLYLIDLDGSNLRHLNLDTGFETDDSYAENRDSYFGDPAWSPDGSSLLYHTLEPDPTSPAGPGFRIHIAEISAAGAVTTDRTLGFDPTADDEFAATWLPSGTGIIFQSVENSVHRMLTADTSVGAQARDLGLVGIDYIAAVVSPDGREIVLSIPGVNSDQRTFSVMDLATLKATPFDAASDDFAWQRTAE